MTFLTDSDIKTRAVIRMASSQEPRGRIRDDRLFEGFDFIPKTPER